MNFYASLQIVVKGRKKAADNVPKWSAMLEILEEAENVELRFE